MTTQQPEECQWFAGCHNDTTQQVDHALLGWVDTCDEHIAWLQEDATEGGINPTKMLPPLVAARLRGNPLADLEGAPWA